MLKPHRILLSFAVLGSLTLALAGCSKSKDGDHDHGLLDFCSLPRACQQIASACHTKDDGNPGPVHDCHEVGHGEGSADECAQQLNSCLTTCNSAPALSDGPTEDLGAQCKDSGSSEAGTGDGG